MPKIKDLPKVDRPREKIEKYGPEKLGDAELLDHVVVTKNSKEIGSESGFFCGHGIFGLFSAKTGRWLVLGVKWR